MSTAASLADDSRILRESIAQASQGLFERRALIEAIILAALAREHVLVVGPPGTGRGLVARRVARVLGGRFFEYLLGPSADPIELFGPVERKSGVVLSPYDDRTGMLSDAEVAFLEEVFEVQTTMINHLQWFLSDRVFRRGAAEVPCALRVCIASTTSLRDSPALRAYDERFLVRAFVSPLSDERLESLLTEGWARKDSTDRAVVGLPRFDRLVAAVDEVEWPAEVRKALADLLRRIRHEGVEIADSRVIRAQRLVAARAVLEGRTTVSTEHLAAVTLAIRTADGQRVAEKLAERPVTQTLRPPSAQRPAIEPTSRKTTERDVEALKHHRPREITQTESYNAKDIKAMLASAGTSDEASGARDALPKGNKGPARPSLPPATRRQSVLPPSSAGHAAVPSPSRRASVAPKNRRSIVPPPSAEQRVVKSRPPAPINDDERDMAVLKRASKAQNAPVPKAAEREPVRLSTVSDAARSALRSTMPDRGAELEEWRANIEQILADIDKLSSQGISSDTVRMLRGLLVDALDASFTKTDAGRARKRSG
ncbi:MAG: AAA family ATPase [Polyangiales bacterium]